LQLELETLSKILLMIASAEILSEALINLSTKVIKESKFFSLYLFQISSFNFTSLLDGNHELQESKSSCSAAEKSDEDHKDKDQDKEDIWSDWDEEDEPNSSLDTLLPALSSFLKCLNGVEYSRAGSDNRVHVVDIIEELPYPHRSNVKILYNIPMK
jgi:hypothetical protein